MLVHNCMSQAKCIYFVAVKANRSLNYASRKCWPFISYIIPNTYYISCNLLPIYHYIIIYLIHYMWISYSKLYQCIHSANRCDQDSQWNHIDNKKNLVQRVFDPTAISRERQLRIFEYWFVNQTDPNLYPCWGFQQL